LTVAPGWRLRRLRPVDLDPSRPLVWNRAVAARLRRPCDGAALIAIFSRSIYRQAFGEVIGRQRSADWERNADGEALGAVFFSLNSPVRPLGRTWQESSWLLPCRRRSPLLGAEWEPSLVWDRAFGARPRLRSRHSGHSPLVRERSDWSEPRGCDEGGAPKAQPISAWGSAPGAGSTLGQEGL